MKYHIWLQEILGAGYKNTGEILKKFKTPKKVFNADIKLIRESGLFTKTQISGFANKSFSNAENIIKKCLKNDIKIIAYSDEKFPQCLKSILNPPLVLYYKGEFPDFDNEPSACIVGPRKISEYGKRAAFSLSSRLARAGINIVSGGAVGSDSYAHKGALKYGLKTIIVMGCGINYPYPAENEKLRSLTLKYAGCLISEYPPDTPAFPSNFPVRNRLMSAMCLSTVVIEAPIKSGALITANHALEQGKDVFVIPGNPGKKEYEGSNLLFRDGAFPLIDASDIFSEYIIYFDDKINVERAYQEIENQEKKEKKIKNTKIFNFSLSNEAKILYNQLDRVEFYPDDFTELLSGDQILSALTELEINGIIKAMPGGRYTVIQ